MEISHRDADWLFVVPWQLVPEEAEEVVVVLDLPAPQAVPSWNVGVSVETT